MDKKRHELKLMPFFYPQLLQNINRKKQMFFYSKKMFFTPLKKKQNGSIQ